MDYALHALKLPRDYTEEQLRAQYKRFALLLHPDRRTMDAASANALFSILTDNYKLLKAALDGGASVARDADWMTMRSDATQRRPDEVAPAPPPPPSSGAAFDVDRFNTRFSQTRLGDENDRGYASWMSRLTPEAAAVRQRQQQEEERRRAAAAPKDALVASEPEGLPSSTSVPYSEIGVARIRDFGRAAAEAGGRRTALNYTDYKVAHMTASCLIDPEVVRARQEFRTLEEYERARSEAAEGAMTDRERDALARRDASEAAREDRRLAAMRARDELVSRHHAKHHAHSLT